MTDSIAKSSNFYDKIKNKIVGQEDQRFDDTQLRFTKKDCEAIAKQYLSKGTVLTLEAWKILQDW